MGENLEILQSVQSQYKEAASDLGLDPAVYEILKDVERLIEVSLPIKMDDGSTKVFKAYRSAHSSILGPSKGGVRFNENVNANEVKALSMMMTIKSALLSLPLGGGKGGLKVDPESLSDRELESLARAYVRAINNYLGSDIDVPAPDVNTNPKIMGYFIDEYIALNGGKVDFGTFTGKPISLGGSLGRSAATGYGLALSVKYAYEQRGESLEAKTFALQGFGNVGYFAAKYLCEFGAILVGLNARDKEAPSGSSAIYSTKGLDVEELQAIRENEGSALNYAKAEKITNEEFFALDVDILLPCALENAIDEKIAPSIKARVIGEGANGPTTDKAAELLEDKGVLIIPDILANSGGVLVSYYEWVQNRTGSYLTLEEVQEKQRDQMTRVFEEVFAIARDKNVNLRRASFMKALERLSDGLKYRGRF
ncbi:Glu/Leu/Phe/Val dehydrogenase [Anaerococcus sp. AGMB09787]|uniref:Glu/Leu/Phe/Val family dehydrogenase n=1 Tax=Anaerococcus sp. AGMB09787 TaxID=2922869 RepID=UPI001FAE7984|nr:Glu/Leu/Phe/Val dehydrogenase [Anaerococcus sp. AGMB09787]